MFITGELDQCSKFPYEQCLSNVLIRVILLFLMVLRILFGLSDASKEINEHGDCNCEHCSGLDNVLRNMSIEQDLLLKSKLFPPCHYYTSFSLVCEM